MFFQNLHFTWCLQSTLYINGNKKPNTKIFIESIDITLFGKYQDILTVSLLLPTAVKCNTDLRVFNQILVPLTAYQSKTSKYVYELPFGYSILYDISNAMLKLEFGQAFSIKTSRLLCTVLWKMFDIGESDIGDPDIPIELPSTDKKINVRIVCFCFYLLFVKIDQEKYLMQ